MRHRAEHTSDAEAPEGRSARVQVSIGAAVVLVILVAVVGVLVSAAAQGGSEVPVVEPTASGSSLLPSPAAVDTGGQLLVHVTGAVRKPGIASLAAGSRVLDAVAAAGGLTDDADPSAVNLARPVADGEQLVVLRVGEAPPPAAAAGGAGGAGAVGGVVNLNTAAQADLETLPRIGPALAQRILDWRQANGRFTAVTDLLKVSGIGQKLFDGLKDRVAV
ncbi:helix-hairpin-helix domain-containing protein [Leifsonia poae]|uniref:helix-hairpin-helix domain-containing protein n=1 Tax=Leifsonia poae TaxID=110933 RepID=UPI003D6975AF